MQQLNLTIEDMTCIHCANRAKFALRQVAGVAKARVNLAEKTAYVEYEPEISDVRALAEAVREEGFTPGASKTRMAVKGMRCASCVSQVEAALNKTPGVISASVNAATAEADITYRPTLIDVEGLSRTVKESSYALAPAMEATEESVDRHADQQMMEWRDLMRKFWFAAVVSIPVMFFSYPDFIPGLRDWMPMSSDNRRVVWGLLGLITLPVLLWSGSQFYTRMWAALKHRTVNMHILIALGISAAFLYSAVTVVFPQWFSTQAFAEAFWDLSTVVVVLVLLGMTLGTSTDVAIEASDITLIKDSLTGSSDCDGNLTRDHAQRPAKPVRRFHLQRPRRAGGDGTVVPVHRFIALAVDRCGGHGL